MALCRFCAGLSIKSLVDLAKVEFIGHEFPRNAYYQHHASFDALEQAADLGCSLCQLILNSFKGSHTEDDRPGSWPTAWLGSRCNIETSMYAIAKELADSNVRISINSDHVYGSNPIEKVYVLDTLLVQVGPLQKPYEPGDEDADSSDPEYWEAGRFWNVPPLCLTLSTPRDQTIRVGGMRIGRFQLDPDLGSKANYSIVREWIKCCRDQHPHCPSGMASNLPTRVIDVGTDHLFRDVRLLCTEKGSKGEYVALSHCWGGKISILLTGPNLEAFQSSIPYARLPANFQDAVKITREIGVRYLWIDSLCIIQDSKQDWEHESKMMGNVYCGSAVTISAMASSGSGQGILRCTPKPPPESPGFITLEVSSDSSQIAELTVQRRDLKEEDLNSLHTYGPLATRGWTLQEWILSPRHLFYGEDQVYWRCPAGFRGADGLPSGLRFPSENYEATQSIILSGSGPKDDPSQTSDINTILSEYYVLVQEYSHRKLTFDSDKLPAFSGIVQRLHTALGGDYLAGIWSRDIGRGLMWSPELKTAIPVADYRAPSWSWAATNEMVLFPADAWKQGPLDLQLLHHNIVPIDRGNPYGEIRSGSLTIKAFVKPLVRSTQIVDEWPCNFNRGSVHFDEVWVHDLVADRQQKTFRAEHQLFRVIEGDDDYLLTLINVGTGESAPGQTWDIDFAAFRPETYLALLVHADIESDDERANSGAYCLALQRVEGSDDAEFRRVGHIYIHNPNVAWLRRWTCHTVTLI